MAEFKISKKDLLGSLGYVSTQSGPVAPARSKIIKLMKSGVKPVKDQTSQYWDTRKYENDSLAAKKNYLNLRDIGIKIMTEATSTTSYAPMRLNLSGMDMSTSNLNGTFMCDGHEVTMNIKYPNANGNISVELTLDTGDTNLYELTPDSDQFQGNFAQSIRLSARDLIKNSTEPADFDEMFSGDGAISGVGNNFNDVLGTAEMMPSSMVANESVDWRLQKLLKVCLEAEGDDMGDMGDMGGMGDMGDMGDMGAADGGMGDTPPENAGEVNGNAGGNGNGDNEISFREYMLDTLKQSGWDNLAKIVADALSKVTFSQYSGVQPSEGEWYGGFPGVKNCSPDDILDQFLSFDDYKALDTKLPKEGLDKFAHAMENDIDINKFKTDLGKWFDGIYNTDGTAINDIAKDVAGMSLPGDSYGAGTGLNSNSSINLDNNFGGMFGGDMGGFNDTEGMMDTADSMGAGGSADSGAGDFSAEDFSVGGEGGIDTAEGPDRNGMNDTDIAVNSLNV